MAASLFPDFIPNPKPSRHRAGKVRALRLLNQAAQRINSILDLETLLDAIVNDVVLKFGCRQNCILLTDLSGENLVVAATRGCCEHGKGARFKIGKEGLVGYTAATGRISYTPDVSKEPRYIACNVDVRSELDIPLYAQGRVIGVFTASHPDLDGFPPEQLEVLHELAGHIAVAVENARRFQQERFDREQLHTKEQEARFIQQALFPKAVPFLAGFKVLGSCVPADAVGGDWYDYISLSGGRWGLVLGDVCGKGVAAALTMSAARALVRSFADNDNGPAAVLARLNRVLMDDLPAGKFVTMVFAVLDPASHTLTFANAGHPWPLFVNGEPRFLETTSGLPLGIAECKFDEHRISLSKGSRVLLYSDGITEACNANGEEYGITRLCNCAANEDASPETVLDDVRVFASGVALADDATMIVVRAE
jgi:sigma-B regulation protein RsbU (phosphoserine phosphatase)